MGVVVTSSPLRNVHITHIISPHPTSSLIGAECAVIGCDWIVLREATQFAVAATNRSALSPDEKCEAVVTRSDEISNMNRPSVAVEILCYILNVKTESSSMTLQYMTLHCSPHFIQHDTRDLAKRCRVL